MPRRVALIHTVRSVLDTFEPRLREAAGGELLVHNMLDDFLASDPAATGTFSEVNERRLASDLMNAALTGADVVAVTCSTMSPAIARLRPSIPVPVVAIDDAMCRRAVGYGPRVTILATARSTVDPTRDKLLYEAAAAGTRIETEVMVCDEAYSAIKNGDKAGHDALVEAMARSIRNADVVVLAQASMAHLERAVQGICGRPTLSSPALCIAEIVGLLGKAGKAEA